MFALTAEKDVGTRGPKRSLVALALSLGLDVDLNAVNAVLGRQIAAALDTSWVDEHDFDRYAITLDGMNRLLEAAAGNLARMSRAETVSNNSVDEVLRAFPWFRPARGKQEAVDRMSDLAGIPRTELGPGGKEHIQTLEGLARRFAPQVLRPGATKHELARGLCREFGVPWIMTGGSTGATVTKEGLNLVLAGAELRAQKHSAAWATAADEGAALVRTLSRELPAHWDGRESVTWMRDAGSTQWRQTEWFGWYFEEMVRTILNEQFPTSGLHGPRVRYGSTTFDYASPTRVWDAKAHTAQQVAVPHDGRRPKNQPKIAWLNDTEAVLACVEEQGLGFLIVDGLAGMDTTGAFRAWHTDYGLTTGKPLSDYVASTGNSRKRKTWWAPLTLRAVWIENTASLDAGIAAGWIRTKRQPDWGAEKRKRNPKFEARHSDAGAWIVASHEWTRSR